MNDLDFGADLRAALHRDADLAGEPGADLLDQLVRRRSHQRRTRIALAGAAAAVIVVAAGVPVGASLLARSDVDPATQTVQPTPSPVSPATSTPSIEVTPAPAETSTPPPAPSVTASTPSASSSALVLGPDGLGTLKMGMTRSEAEATGLIAPFQNIPNSDRCLWSTHLKGAPSGHGVVLHSQTFGVATIDAYAGVHTPEGIGIGSPLDEVVKAYPDFYEDEHLHRSLVPVPGESQLVYRIAWDNDRNVIELTLQYAHQDCYE